MDKELEWREGSQAVPNVSLAMDVGESENSRPGSKEGGMGQHLAQSLDAVRLKGQEHSVERPSASESSTDQALWSCRRCTFLNHVLLPQCEICGLLRCVQKHAQRSEPSARLRGSSNSLPARSRRQTSWEAKDQGKYLVDNSTIENEEK